MAKSKAKAVHKKAATRTKPVKARASRELINPDVNGRMPIQNGVTRPRADTASGEIWKFLDTASEKLGSPTPVAPALEHFLEQCFEATSIRNQYALWRKFYGIKGRIVKEKK